MQLSEENIRLIFGLKLKQLRSEKNLSLAELSVKSGLSISYLNEIEKGKKYPKGSKISALATALEVPYDKLVSLKLSRNLAPVGDLLQSGILSELPLELFGIELNKLIEMIANAPDKVNAFISTIIEIARNYNLTQESFYFAALRSYQESNDNYFDDLEKKAESFIREHRLSIRNSSLVNQLEKILSVDYNYQTETKPFTGNPHLEEMRSITLQGNPSRLLINPALDSSQRSFILAKELAFCYLELHPRIITSPLLKADSFDQVLNNFKASYFAGAVLMQKDAVVKDLEKFFLSQTWDEQKFLDLIEKYTSSHETFMHRLTNILPKAFHLSNLFFLRFDNKHDSDYFLLTKELHLSQLHNPHGNESEEHYCRRWVSIRVLKELEGIRKKNKYRQPVIGIQRSVYNSSGNEYLIISVAKPLENIPGQNNSVSIGILINHELKKRIRFWENRSIPVKQVEQTCERCPISNCKERAADPVILGKKNRHEKIIETIKLLSQSNPT